LTRRQVREREARWRIPVAIASFLGVLLLVATNPVSGVSGDGEAAILRSIDAHSGSVLISGLIQAAALALFALVLAYFFKAVAARSDSVRTWALPLALAAFALLGVSAVLTSLANNEGADTFVAGEAEPGLSGKEAKEECVSERRDEGAGSFGDEYEPKQGETPLAACERRKLDDDAASEALKEASLRPVSSILGVIGGLGVAASFFYVGLWSMRTGLLSRLWGSIGMVAGITILLGIPFVVLVWFIYTGLLALGAVPGGRPPAWEAGEAVPWPTPGEKAAAELQGEGEDEGPVSGPSDGSDGSPDTGDGPPRKRKQRD
jgi:hypothetical protein